jgi:hypothetical protein
MQLRAFSPTFFGRRLTYKELTDKDNAEEAAGSFLVRFACVSRASRASFLPRNQLAHGCFETVSSLAFPCGKQPVLSCGIHQNWNRSRAKLIDKLTSCQYREREVKPSRGPGDAKQASPDREKALCRPVAGTVGRHTGRCVSPFSIADSSHSKFPFFSYIAGMRLVPLRTQWSFSRFTRFQSVVRIPVLFTGASGKSSMNAFSTSDA